jgi:PPK2 family polyphosphate:nucleotide phosphotransferase
MKNANPQKHTDSEHIHYSEEFRVAHKSHIKLSDFNPRYADKHEKKKTALAEIEKLKQRMDQLQFQLFSEQKRSLLICLQALDAGGKDGVIKHVTGSMNPQGCRVASFKEPSKEALAHDFLWRVEQQTPKQGEVVIFNRSHYEDVLVVRVHDLVAKDVWSKRYEQINDFERRLIASGTHILKFFLHISKEEQLERFKQRLDDPLRQWKISESDYSERTYWDSYEKAYNDAISKCSSDDAPWFIIPSDHKWFRDLAISQIIVEKLENMHIEVPKPSVNIAGIRKKYHHAVEKAKDSK